MRWVNSLVWYGTRLCGMGVGLDYVWDQTMWYGSGTRLCGMGVGLDYVWDQTMWYRSGTMHIMWYGSGTRLCGMGLEPDYMSRPLICTFVTFKMKENILLAHISLEWSSPLALVSRSMVSCPDSDPQSHCSQPLLEQGGNAATDRWRVHCPMEL